VKLHTALSKADADAALAGQGLDRLGGEDGDRPTPLAQRVKTDMEVLMSKGFADFPGAAIAELLSGCNLKFWFLPSMHPEAKIKLREMRFKVRWAWSSVPWLPWLFYGHLGCSVAALHGHECVDVQL
jgi:hypothetical protein